jgi:hypothetical protein
MLGSDASLLAPIASRSSGELHPTQRQRMSHSFLAGTTQLDCLSEWSGTLLSPCVGHPSASGSTTALELASNALDRWACEHGVTLDSARRANRQHLRGIVQRAAARGVELSAAITSHHSQRQQLRVCGAPARARASPHAFD